MAKKTNKKKASGKSGSSASTKPKQYEASFYSSPASMPPALSKSVLTIEKEMKCKVVLFWQCGGESKQHDEISPVIFASFLKHINELPEDEPVIVLINSPGGLGDIAYRMARLLQDRCGSYYILVPFWCKSAATLFALGARRIILGKYAEFGPLDAQLTDFEREEKISALEVVQSLERLNSEAMKAVDQNMTFWAERCGKKVETLLPIATKFVADLMRPVFDKIDTVEWTKHARVLKVAQDYAERLLQDNYDQAKAEQIADRLTNNYCEHGFVLDHRELEKVGLTVEYPDKSISDSVDNIVLGIRGTFIGPIREVK